MMCLNDSSCSGLACHKQSCKHSQVQRWEFWGIKAMPAPVALSNFQACNICSLQTICHFDKLPT